MDNTATVTNTITLHADRYISVELKGDQTYLSIDSLRPEAIRLAEKLRFQHKDVLGLIDMTEMTSQSAGSNKAAFEVLGDIAYKKVAIFGSNETIKTVTNLLIQAIGKGAETKIFTDKTAALTWLYS